MNESILPEHMLLMKFHGVDPQTMLDSHGRRIHQAYMSRFGDNPGTFTIFVLGLTGAWDFAVRYQGSTSSAAWLESAVQEAAAGEGGSADTVTVEITGDITDFFDGGNDQG